MDIIVWVLLIFAIIIGIGALFLLKGVFKKDKPPEIEGNKQLRKYVESKNMKPLAYTDSEIPFAVSPKVVISYPSIGHHKALSPTDIKIDLPVSDRYDRDVLLQRINILTSCEYVVEIDLERNKLIYHKPHHEPVSIDLDKIKNIDWT